MRRVALLSLLALVAAACDETPADVPAQPAVTYGAANASPYVDLGHRPPSVSPPLARAPSAKPGSNAIENGGFEANGGAGSTNLDAWGTYNEGSGGVFAQTGSESPISGFQVPVPPEGDFAAMADQTGPGLHILYQDVQVPAGATLGFDLYIGNRAEVFHSPPTLSPSAFPNQQLRVDIMDPGAPLDDVGAGVLANVYQTAPGDPPESGYSRVVADLSAFEGQTVRIRFAQVDTEFFFQGGIDNVVVGREPSGGGSGGGSGGPPTNVISGSGHIGSGGSLRSFSVSARREADGSATGSFQLYARESDARVHGIVTCVTIFGRTAWIGGRITTAGPYEGRDAIFRVADLGAGTKGNPDRISLLQPRAPGQAQLFCDQAPNFPDLAYEVQGNITVSAPGETSFTEVYVDELVDAPVWVPCAADGAGEWVRFSGGLLNVFHFTEDRAGGFKYMQGTMLQDVVGYGEVTGDRYIVNGPDQGYFHGTISGVPSTETFVWQSRVIGPGSASDMHLHGVYHFTLNANGELTVFRDSLRMTCR